MSTGRIEAFSDGVFAIVVTLLVLEFHVPQVQGPDASAALARGLTAMLPKLLSYMLSFLIICIWWIAHHHLFHLLKRSDRGLLWLNCLFLMFLAFIPFPTALMGDYPSERIAVVSYGVVMTATGLCFSGMRYYAFYVGALVGRDVEPSLLKNAMRRSAAGPALHLVAIALAFVDPRWAIAMYTSIPLLYVLPSRLEKQSSRSEPSGNSR